MSKTTRDGSGTDTQNKATDELGKDFKIEAFFLLFEHNQQWSSLLYLKYNESCDLMCFNDANVSCVNSPVSCGTSGGKDTCSDTR